MYRVLKRTPFGTVSTLNIVQICATYVLLTHRSSLDEMNKLCTDLFDPLYSLISDSDSCLYGVYVSIPYGSIPRTHINMIILWCWIADRQIFPTRVRIVCGHASGLFAYTGCEVSFERVVNSIAKMSIFCVTCQNIFQKCLLLDFVFKSFKMFTFQAYEFENVFMSFRYKVLCPTPPNTS